MSKFSNSSEPAFPCECTYSGDKIDGVQTSNYSGMAMGITKREYFAAMAMQALITKSSESTDIATRCWEIADSVLEQA